MYVLDTNIVSAVMRGDPGVVGHLHRAGTRAVSVPEPVLAEIAYGIERLPQSRRRSGLAHRFEVLRNEIARLPWTDDVSFRFGIIKAELERTGNRLEDFDIAIAAHAVSIGATLATANVGQMSRIPGLVIEDWTAGP